MASSSYCDLIITLKDGKEISWIGEDSFSPLFQVPKNAKKTLTEMSTLKELKSFILDCASVYEEPEAAKELYKDWCKDFDKELNTIKSFKDIKSFYLGWGEYDPEDGFPAEEVASGESIEIDFETKKCKKKTTPSKDFLNEMNEIYGDIFDEFED